jgi:hypothetical protein
MNQHVAKRKTDEILHRSIARLEKLEVGQESPALSLTTHIPLPNVKGRIDHARVDLKGQRFFVGAVANDTREVIDLKSSQRVQTITDLEEPQAVYYRRFHQSPLCSLRWERRHESV